MTPVMKRVFASAGFYPITAFYIAAVCVAAALTKGSITLLAGATLLALAAILMVLLATWRELKTVHRMMDGQRAEMLSRIDELSDLLRDAGIQPPAPGPKELEARLAEDAQEPVA